MYRYYRFYGYKRKLRNHICIKCGKEFQFRARKKVFCNECWKNGPDKEMVINNKKIYTVEEYINRAIRK